MARTSFALYSALTLLVASNAALALLPEGMTIENDVRVDETPFVRVFEGHRFFPGYKLTIHAMGSVDSHHQYWEDRVCSWFGLKCWHEPREAATIVNTSTFPVLLSIRDPAGAELSAITRAVSEGTSEVIAQAVNTDFSDRPEKYVAPRWTANESFTLLVDYPGADQKWEPFGRPVQFFARIVDRGAGKAPLFRNRCEGRPRHCGGGAYRLKVMEVDTSARMDMLENLLKEKVSPGTVIPRLRQDRLLVDDREPERRVRLARALYNQSLHHADVVPKLEYLEYAVELDRSPKNADISNALAQTHLASGNVTAAKLENEKTFKSVQEEYAAAKGADKLTIKLVRDYFAALKIAAQIGAVDRSGLYSGDLIKAVAVYVKASEVAAEGLRLQPGETDRRELTRYSFEALVDASRLLMMMRSRQNMVQAEELMSRAIKISQGL
jgi:hypothetical protein